MMPAMMMPLLVVAANPAEDPQADIEAALAASGAGWNAGDLDRFMAVYADDAIFTSGGAVKRGKAEIARSYARSVAGPANARGTLSVKPVVWRPLSQLHMLLVARWTLAGATSESGLTTLQFERRKAGWQIIADHSS